MLFNVVVVVAGGGGGYNLILLVIVVFLAACCRDDEAVNQAIQHELSTVLTTGGTKPFEEGKEHGIPIVGMRR